MILICILAVVGFLADGARLCKRGVRGSSVVGFLGGQDLFVVVLRRNSGEFCESPLEVVPMPIASHVCPLSITVSEGDSTRVACVRVSLGHIGGVVGGCHGGEGGG